MSPAEFLEIVNWVEEQADQKIGPANSIFSEKADGIGLRFGLDENDRFFLESSRSGPQFDKGSFGKFAIGKSGKTNKISDTYDDIHATLFDDKVLNAILKKYNTNGIKVVGEGFYLPNGVDHDDDKDLVKFIATYYRKDKLGSWATFVLFDVLDGNGNKHPDADKIIKSIKTLSNKKVTYEDSSTDVNDSVDFKAEIKELRTLIASIEKKEARTINDILTDKSRKRDATTKRKEIKAEILKIQKLFADKLGKLIKGKWGPQLEGLVVQLANGTAFKVISDTFKEQKKDFKSIFKQMRESVISEATWYDPKYIGKVLEVKPVENTTSIKLASYFHQIAGKRFTRINKSHIPDNTNIIQVGSEPNTKKYRLGQLGKVNSGYFKGEDDGLYYVFVGLPTAAISEYNVKNGIRLATGARATALQESSVAQLIALVANSSKFKTAGDLVKFLTDESPEFIVETIKKNQDDYNTTETPEECINYLQAAPHWIKQNALIAVEVTKKFKIGSNHLIHRGSTVSDSLESLGVQLANKVNKTIKQKDKWNPADIWIENKSGDINKLMNSKDIYELNELLIKGSTEKSVKTMLGVSLKAVGKSVQFSFYNFDSESNSKDLAITSVETAKKGVAKGIRVKDTKNSIEINFRNSAGNKFVKSLAGIISGKFAQMGSVTTAILFRQLSQTVPTFSTKPDFYLKDGHPTKQSYELYRKYISLANQNLSRLKVKKVFGEIFDLDSFEDFEKIVETALKDNKNEKNTAIAINSSLIALSLLSVIDEDTFNYAYQYASAQTNESGPFVKVH